MPPPCIRRALCLFVVLSVAFETCLAAVLAIDYGSDWMKASLMKPGLPFDVLLNKDSKRKVQSSVAWKKDERIFGVDAANLVCSLLVPQDLSHSYRLLGFLWTPSRH